MIKLDVRMRSVLTLAAILAAIALVYFPGLGGGYAFDDYPNIVDNIPLRVTHPIWKEWMAAILSSPSSASHRPLSMLTFAINHYFTGLDPRPMKLTNIAIHMLNAMLVFGLVRSLLRAMEPSGSTEHARSDRAALFATTMWALHPINLMAVLYVVQRMESLCHTFVFAGLWMYVAGRARQQNNQTGWALVLVGLLGGTAMGILAKESAALLPLYALCIELCVFGFRNANMRRDPRMLALFGGVLVLPGIAGLAWLLPKFFQPGAFLSRDFTMGQRLLTEARVVIDYLHWIVLPDLGQLGLSHDDYVVSHGLLSPPSTLIALLGIGALLAASAYFRRRRPLVSLGILWFLGAQVLTATFIPFELVFEHRNYFASLGICLALADLLLLVPVTHSARRTGAMVALAFVLFCAGTTYLRASEWSSPLEFSATEAAKHPQSSRATYGLARSLIVETGYDPKSPLVGQTFAALEHARQIPRRDILPDHAALIFAARIGTPLKPIWWSDMQDKLRHPPLGPQEIGALAALTNCAVDRHCPFPSADMLATFGAAMSQGDDPGVLHIYGNYVLNVLGDDATTLRVWQQACKLAPGESQYRISLTKLLIGMGRYNEARMQIAQLRAMGQMSQYAAAADILDTRLRDTIAARARPAPAPAHAQ